MALSGSVQTSAWKDGTGREWRIVLNWNATQNIEDNITTIYWDIKCATTQTGYVVVGEVRATINETQVFFRSAANQSNCSNGTQIASGTLDVPHNNDGTKSVSMKIEAGIYNWALTEVGSSTFTLDTIARASVITSTENIPLGDACNIKWTPASSSFTYKLKFSIGSWSYTTEIISPDATKEFTYTGYIVPLLVANQLHSATSGTMNVTLYTYSDSTGSIQIGSPSTKAFIVSVPESVVPIISSCDAEIVNPNSVIDGWGVAVSGYTMVKVNADATGSYGSTISSFIIGGGYSATKTGTSLSYTGGVITSSGDKIFEITAKDSRGRLSQTARTTAITFYAYSKPTVISFTATRSTSDQSKVIVMGNWSFSSVNSKNSATGTLYYKKSTDTIWTNYGMISINTSTTLDVNFDTTISYNFKLVVTDALSNSAQDEVFISTMKVLLDFRAGGKGLGVGKICESDSMEVALDAKFFGTVYINGVTLEEYIRSIVG